MDAALLRNALAQHTNLATLIRAGRGVAHNPACTPGPTNIRWTKTAETALGKRAALKTPPTEEDREQ